MLNQAGLKPGGDVIRTWAIIGSLSALLCAACEDVRVQRPTISGADPGRGKAVIARVGCGACHVIPGVPWPQGRVGPSLDGYAEQALIAGRFANRPETLALWVANAPALSPETAMPAMPITEQEARDVAAYLYTLDAR